jgi:hypothetical protein
MHLHVVFIHFQGFPLNKHLDHPETKAIFVGWGLVRGVKTYFDIKTKGVSREFMVRFVASCSGDRIILMLCWFQCNVLRLFI